MVTRMGMDTAVGAVCVVVVAVYAWPLLDPSRDWQFVLMWDDLENFVDNDVYKGLTLDHLRGIFSLAIINVWEPFGWLLKALVYAIFGLNSRAYRIVTLALHIGAAVVLAKTSALVLAIMHGGNQLTQKRSSVSATTELDPRRHFTGCALAALIVFVVHPINVEVVAWPSAQPYALAAFFSALSLFFHCRRLHRVVMQQLFVSSPRAARGASPESESIPSDWDRLIDIVAPSITDRETQVSAVCFVAAVLSKSVCILLPVATLLIDLLVVLPVAIATHWRTEYIPAPALCLDVSRRYALSKSLLVSSAVLFVTITVVVNEEGAHQHADIITLTLYERVIKAISTPAWILRCIVWPAHLRPHYRLHEDEIAVLGNPEYLLSVAVLPLSGAWLFTKTTLYRIPTLLAMAYFCVMVLPTCGLIQHGMVAKGADRYAYFPMMVFIPIVGQWLSTRLDLEARDEASGFQYRMEDDGDRARGPRKTGERLAPSHTGFLRLACVTILATYLAIDVQQMHLWENSDKLIEHSLRLDGTDGRVQHIAYENQVKWGGGCNNNPEKCKNWLHLAHYYAPVKTEKAKLYRYMIMILLDRKDLACKGYALMADEYPDSAIVENNLAICAIMDDRPLDARSHIQRAQTLKFYDSHSRSSITENYAHIIKWVDQVTTSDSAAPIFAKMVW